MEQNQKQRTKHFITRKTDVTFDLKIIHFLVGLYFFPYLPCTSNISLPFPQVRQLAQQQNIVPGLLCKVNQSRATSMGYTSRSSSPLGYAWLLRFTMLCCCLTIAWCLLRFSQGNLLLCGNNLSFINFINLALLFLQFLRMR